MAKQKGRRRVQSPPETGDLLFDLPYGVTAPHLTNPDIGLVAWRNSGKGYTITVTLLDAPDHRLLRAGVVLAHRVLDGQGQWYLAAPDWTPYLPAEQVLPMSRPELPADLAALVLPFRRHAPLGPVAALTCRRTNFVAVDGRKQTVGRLRDDRVTVRRNGIVVSRYREVSLRPTRHTMASQLLWLSETFEALGATAVPRLPSLRQRLGAPATGLTDLPAPQGWTPKDSLESFVSALLARRMRDLVAADLGVRTGLDHAREDLTEVLKALRVELRGLAPMLDPAWLAEVEHDVARALPPVDDRHLAVLEHLVTGSRAPRLGDFSNRGAATVLRQEIESSMRIVQTRCGSLSVDGNARSWAAALAVVEQVRSMCTVLEVLHGRRRGLAKLLGQTADQLEAGLPQPVMFRGHEVDDRYVVSLDPLAAFEAGRHAERETLRLTKARERLIAGWPKTVRKMRRLEER